MVISPILTEFNIQPKLIGRNISKAKFKEASSRFRPLRNGYLLSLTIPGFRRDNFDIRINNNILRITASKSVGPSCKGEACEQKISNWEKSFRLPADADAQFAACKYHNDQLNIIFSKKNNAVGEKGEYRIFVY